MTTNSPIASTEAVAPAPKSNRLRGNLGVAALVFTVLAANAPLGTTVGFVPATIGFGNGLGAPSAYLVAMALVLVFAAGFTAMGRRLENPGAFYAYITAGLGRPIGLGSSFIAIFSYLFVVLGTYCFGGISLQALVVNTFSGPDIPWWVFTLILVTATGILGYFKIALSARVLGVMLVLEVIVVLVFDAAVVFGQKPEGVSLVSFTPSAFVSGSLGLGLLFAILCFSGFEATAIFREEVRDPNRTIPRATFAAVLVLGGLYALGSWVLIQAVGPSSVLEAAGTDPAATTLGAMGVYLGKVVVDIITVLLCTSIFAACLALHNVTARYIYNLAVDRIFPVALSRVHPRHGSPYRSSLLASLVCLVAIIAFALSGANPGSLYATLSGIGGYSLVLMLLLTSIAIAVFFRRTKKEKENVWNAQIAPVLSVIGFTVAIVLATLNLDALLGGSRELSLTMLAVTYGLGIVGVVVATALRSRRPETYARIGRQEV